MDPEDRTPDGERRDDASPSDPEPTWGEPADPDPRPDPAPEPPPEPADPESSSGWAVGSHLITLVGLVPGVPLNLAGLLAALLMWQFFEREHPVVRPHAREAFNFQANVMICLAVAELLVASIVGCCLGLPFYVMTWGANVCFTLVGALAAGEGKRFRYPCFWRPLDAGG